MDTIKFFSQKITSWFLLTILLFPLLANGCGGPQSGDSIPSQPDEQLPNFIIESPYSQSSYSYKAQTHVHSYTSSNPADTSDSRFAVENAYRDMGYAFIFLTNHNVVTDDPKVGCDSSNQQCIIHIPSGESGWACPHHMIVLGNKTPSLLNWGNDNLDAILALGITSILFPPLQIILPSWFDDWLTDCSDIQGRIDKFSRDGSLVVIAHPQGSCKIGGQPCYDFGRLSGATGYTGIEIWSDDVDSTKYWDTLSMCSKEPVWGFAADDCEDLSGSAFNVGWNMVNSNLDPVSDYVINDREEELRQDILYNIQSGNFYAVHASNRNAAGGQNTDDYSGPRVWLDVNGQKITVTTDNQETIIRFIVQMIGGEKEIASETVGTISSYTVSGEEIFVRVEVEQDVAISSYTLQPAPGEPNPPKEQQLMRRYIVYSQPLYVLERNPDDQGVDLTVRGLRISPQMIHFYRDCRANKDIIIKSGAEQRIILPPGIYKVTIDTSALDYHYENYITVPLSGFVPLEIIQESEFNP